MVDGVEDCCCEFGWVLWDGDGEGEGFGVGFFYFLFFFLGCMVVVDRKEVSFAV